ncbi:MAG TPA: type II CAAX endopeptidase family protein [Candidatus Saccharimonadales bacterium]
MSGDSSKPALTKRQVLSSQVRIVGFVFLVMLMSIVGVQLVVGVFMSLFPHAIGWDTSNSVLWYSTPLANFAAIALSEGLAVWTIYYVVRLQKFSFYEFVGLKKFRWWYPFLAFAGMGTYMVLFIALYSVMQRVLPTETSGQALGFDTNVGGITLWLAGIGLIVLPPLAEEIVFRGFIYGTLRKAKIPVAGSVLLTSLIFGTLHIFTGSSGLLWSALVDTFTLSVVLCVLREQTGSIWTGIFVHAMKNGFVFVNLFILHAH